MTEPTGVPGAEHPSRLVRPRAVIVTVIRRALPFLLVPLLLLAAGCAILPWELPGVGASPKPTGGGAVREQLETQHAVWQAAGITDYELKLAMHCFCQPHDPVRVTVVDGLVTDVRLPNGDPADAWYRDFPLTIDELYARIATVLDKGGSADVTYGEGGVPTRVGLDPILDAVDDESGIDVLAFTPAG